MKDTIRNSTAVRTVSALTAIAIFISALLIFMPVKASAQDNVSFILPMDKSYKVTVFGKYSWGDVHESYIQRWIYGKGSVLENGIVMDIAAPRGTPVYAMADGYIYQNNSHSAGGFNVVIKHDNGGFSYYGHLLYRSSLKRNTRVKAGDQIGLVGKSGSGATGYHLHYECSWEDAYCHFRELGADLSVMDDSGASVYPHNCTWSHSVSDGEEVYVSNGTYRIMTADSRFCLDVNHGNAGSIENGRNCEIYSVNNSGAQSFRVTRLDDGWYMIEHIYSGKVLDVNGETGNIYVWEKNYSDCQKWKFYKNGNGYYLLNKYNGKYLDVYGAEFYDCNNIQTYSQNTSAAQRFYLQPETYGVVRRTDGCLITHNAKNFYDSSAIGDVKEGQVVTIISRESRFTLIRYGTNTQGWVSSRYVDIV